MVKISFDNTSVCAELQPDGINGSVIRRELAKAYPEQEKFLVYIRADAGEDTDYTDEALNKILTGNPRTITFVTATARELAIASIHDSVVMLEQIKESMRQCADRLRRGEIAAAMGILSKDADWLKFVVDMMRAIHRAGLINLTGGKDYAAVFEGHTGGIGGILTRIEESINLEDTLGVSELLVYELIPAVENWQNTMPSLYRDILDPSSLH